MKNESPHPPVVMSYCVFVFDLGLQSRCPEFDTKAAWTAQLLDMESEDDEDLETILRGCSSPRLLSDERSVEEVWNYFGDPEAYLWDVDASIMLLDMIHNASPETSDEIFGRLLQVSGWEVPTFLPDALAASLVSEERAATLLHCVDDETFVALLRNSRSMVLLVRAAQLLGPSVVVQRIRDVQGSLSSAEESFCRITCRSLLGV